MIRVASHQPCFLPWAGFWHKFLSADHFVLSAGVEYAKDGFINRTQHNGAWLTLPIQAKDTDLIRDIEIADDPRRIAKTWKTVAQQSGPYRDRLVPIIEMLKRVQPGDRLADINTDLIVKIAAILGATNVRPHYDGINDTGGTKTERLLLRMMRNVPTMDAYMMGRGAAEYFNQRTFASFHCMVQDLVRDPGMSIVQLIATAQDPAAVIRSSFRWASL